MQSFFIIDNIYLQKTLKLFSEKLLYTHGAIFKPDPQQYNKQYLNLIEQPESLAIKI